MSRCQYCESVHTSGGARCENCGAPKTLEAIREFRRMELADTAAPPRPTHKWWVTLTVALFLGPFLFPFLMMALVMLFMLGSHIGFMPMLLVGGFFYLRKKHPEMLPAALRPPQPE